MLTKKYNIFEYEPCLTNLHVRCTVLKVIPSCCSLFKVSIFMFYVLILWKMQAFIFESFNIEFCQCFLTCRAKFRKSPLFGTLTLLLHFCYLDWIFPQKVAQGLTRSCKWDDSSPYFWHLQCLLNYRLWLAVFTVLRLGKDGRYGFEISPKHWVLVFLFSLLVRLIWFCEMIKRSLFFQISKEWPNTNLICIDVWRLTTHSGMLFSAIETFQNQKSFTTTQPWLVGALVAAKPWNFYSPEPLPLLP